MATDILSDPEPAKASPVDSLPVAAGKNRRGRPRGRRVADAAIAVLDGADAASPQSSPDLVADIKHAVEEAVKRPKAPGAMTRKGIVSAARAVARSTVRSLVNRELKASDPSPPGLESQIHDVISAEQTKGVLTTEHGQSHPFWHLLRLR